MIQRLNPVAALLKRGGETAQDTPFRQHEAVSSTRIVFSRQEKICWIGLLDV